MNYTKATTDGIMEVSDKDSGGLDRLVVVDDILDLAELDTLIMKLDLTILLATVNSVSIGTGHCNISSVVYAFTRHKGVGVDAFSTCSGQFGYP